MCTLVLYLLTAWIYVKKLYLFVNVFECDLFCLMVYKSIAITYLILALKVKFVRIYQIAFGIFYFMTPV